MHANDLPTLNRQQGLSGLGLLYVLVATGVLATLAFKLVPPYIDNYGISTTVASLDTVPDLNDKTEREVRTLVMNRLRVNNVRDVPTEAVVVSRIDDRVLVAVDYETRVNLFGNIDAVIRFENRYPTDLP